MADNHIIQKKITNRAFQFSVELNVLHDAAGTVWYNSISIYRWLKSKYRDVYKLPYKIPFMFSKEKLDIFYREGQHFCCRLEHSDEKLQGREWITEIEVISLDEKVFLGVKVSYTTPEDADYERDIFSVPTVVRQIFKKNGFRDVRELNKTILEADSVERLTELYDLILDKNRLFPVIVVTDFKGDTANWTEARVFSEGILYNLGLIAHVAYIPHEMCFKWKEMVGEGWDVYNGAVRTYYRNVDFDDSDFYNHPLFTAQRIDACEYVNRDGEKKTGRLAFVDLLAKRVIKDNTHMRVDWKGRGHKFFSVARSEAEWARIKADAVKIRSATEKEWEEFYAEIIDSFEKERAELKSELDEVCELYNRLDEDLSAKKNQIYALQGYIEALQQKLAEAGRAEEILPAESECKCKDIPNWIDTYFAGKLYLTSRAKRSLKKFSYGKPRLIYEWLQFLGTEYRQNRMGELDMDALKAKAADIGIDVKDLSESPISDTRRGEQGDEYYVDYHGKKIPMENHIGKGTSTEERYTFRIYFYWDEDNSIVVICDLTNHLETRAS